MAQVTVRVKLNRTFELTCDAENADEALDYFVDSKVARREFAEACLDEMEVVDGVYDIPEPPEEEEDEEEEEA